MRHPALALSVISLALTGCAAPPHLAEFTNGYPTHDCPEFLNGKVTLRAEARPVELRLADFKQTSIATSGALGRRLLISVTPEGMGPKDRIIWSALTVATYGGTLLGWDNLDLQTENERDISTVDLSPGQLKVQRIAKEGADLAGAQSIDLVVMPGGVEVDDTVVRSSALWREDGSPLPADHINLQLTSMRHPPGLDVVEATAELTYVIRLGNTRDQWVCSAQTRLTLIDREALRQPYWDLGLGSANASRKQRLALFDPTLGAVRLVFESAASAHSFATWLRTTHATQVGSYPLSVFDQTNTGGVRPFGPVSDNLMSTLRRLTSEDMNKIKVGLAGEP